MTWTTVTFSTSHLAPCAWWSSWVNIFETLWFVLIVIFYKVSYRFNCELQVWNSYMVSWLARDVLNRFNLLHLCQIVWWYPVHFPGFPGLSPALHSLTGQVSSVRLFHISMNQNPFETSQLSSFFIIWSSFSSKLCRRRLFWPRGYRIMGRANYFLCL